MNGAESLVKTLVDAGIEVCFTNPGTSEMHFVAALDEVPGMRSVLGLFEGVVSGAADGYARIAGKPAAGNSPRVLAPARETTRSAACNAAIKAGFREEAVFNMMGGFEGGKNKNKSGK